MRLLHYSDQWFDCVDYRNEGRWGVVIMDEDAKLIDLVHSDLSQNRVPSVSRSTPIGSSPDKGERHDRVMIQGGLLAGWHGQRIPSHAPARCLVQLERNGCDFLVEIDENLVVTMESGVD